MRILLVSWKIHVLVTFSIGILICLFFLCRTLGSLDWSTNSKPYQYRLPNQLINAKKFHEERFQPNVLFNTQHNHHCFFIIRVKMSSPPVGKNRSWFRYFQFEETKDSPSEARNALLVVFTLIATVTFQAGITPPGGVWQDDKNGSNHAGRAIYASQTAAFYVFLISNTVAFSTSIFVIVSLTHKFPFQLEIRVAAASMLATFVSSIFAITPDDVHFRYVLIAVVVPFVIRFLIHMFSKFRNRTQQNPPQFVETEIPNL